MDKIKFLDASNFGNELSKDLTKCSYFHVAVSYIRLSGIQPLLALTSEQIENSQIITCTDFGITEPKALYELINCGYRIRVFRDAGLHAKSWITFFPDRSTVLYVGSSNLSHSAISSNTEANLRTTDPAAIETAIRWFSDLATSNLTHEIDTNWIQAYEKKYSNAAPQEVFLIAPESQAPDFVTPNGKWHSQGGAKTFLSQGIVSGVNKASPSKPLLLERARVSNQARIVLLARNKTGDLYIYADVLNATLNLIGDSSVQFGGGRRQVHEWMDFVWNFDSDTSIENYSHSPKDWEEWLKSTGFSYSDFQYEILVDLKDLIPTIWVRPVN
jgi:HKD family nuclease